MALTLENKRIKLMGHILRAENKDPIRAITFEHNSANPIHVGKRRVGGPRQHWVAETLKLVCKHHYPDPTPNLTFINDPHQRNQIYSAAQLRKF